MTAASEATCSIPGPHTPHGTAIKCSGARNGVAMSPDGTLASAAETSASSREWEDHLLKYHQMADFRFAGLPLFGGYDPETCHWRKYATCTWAPGQCTRRPHEWKCVTPGPQGPDAGYRCKWCPAAAKGSEIAERADAS